MSLTFKHATFNEGKLKNKNKAVFLCCFLLPYLALTLVCREMGWLGIIIFLLDGYARAYNLSCLDPFYSYLLIPEEKNNIWSELESNPGPLASCTQATALTTRPWLLGRLRPRSFLDPV